LTWRKLSDRDIEATVIGTAAYMSPEQAQGKPLDERSDVFSFGALLYEAIGGDRAFGGSSVLDTLNAVVREEPRPLEVPEKIARVVARCLRKRPADGFKVWPKSRGLWSNALPRFPQ